MKTTKKAALVLAAWICGVSAAMAQHAPAAETDLRALTERYLESVRQREAGDFEAARASATALLDGLGADPAGLRPALLEHLARVHDEGGRPAEATPLFEQVLALETQRYGADSPKLDAALMFLAGNLARRRQYDAAEAQYLRLLSIRERQRGPAHHDLELPLHGLATLYHRQGRDDDTERVLRRILALWSRPVVLFGVRFDNAPRALQSLGAVHWRRGQLDEAIRQHEAARTRLDRDLAEAGRDGAFPGNGTLARSIENLDRLALLQRQAGQEAAAAREAAEAARLRRLVRAEAPGYARSWGQAPLPLAGRD